MPYTCVIVLQQLHFEYDISGDVLTGDSNGNVFIWGRGYNAVTKALRNVHEGPIFSICVLKDGSIVTGGGKDRKMVQFDSTYRKSGLEATVSMLSFLRTFPQKCPIYLTSSNWKI